MPEFYPQPLAGQKITASLLRSMLPQIVRKTADTSRSATTTYEADPHLVFPAEAGAVYVMWGWVKYFASTTPDIKIRFTVPTGCLGEWAWIMPGSGTGASATAGYSIRTDTNDVGAGRTGYGTSDTQQMTPMGALFRMSTTAGNISLEWAQNTSDATASVLYTDSWLAFQRIA